MQILPVIPYEPLTIERTCCGRFIIRQGGELDDGRTIRRKPIITICDTPEDLGENVKEIADGWGPLSSW